MADTYQPFIPDNGEERPQRKGFQSLWPGRIKPIGSFSESSESSESAKRKKKKRNVVLLRFITVWLCIIAFICLNIWAGRHFGSEALALIWMYSFLAFVVLLLLLMISAGIWEMCGGKSWGP